MRPIILFLWIPFFLFSCQEKKNLPGVVFDSFKEKPTPCQEGGEPNLFVTDNEETYLTWVEYLNDSTDALLFSKLENGKWSSPKTIASGSDWFVNWADFPSLVTYKDDGKSMAAHWLQKRAEGTYDYDVHISQSLDGGETWNPSFIPHRDSIAAEHGFVSMLPLSPNNIFATWLDGRNTKGEGHEGQSHGHGHHGAMTLRAAVFDKNGNLSEEAELDNRICDCCQTAAVQTDEGIIVAYRDRSEKEIRDISIVRKINGEWTSPEPISNDNWKIAGCPVNGPSLAAQGNSVALSWFTRSDEKPKVKIAFSSNGGATFGEPIRIDEGDPLGRVDVVMISEGQALVSWLEQKKESAAVKLVAVNHKGIIGEKFTITESKASRQSGFPRMVKTENQIILAWTHVGEKTNVKTAILDLNCFFKMTNKYYG